MLIRLAQGMQESTRTKTDSHGRFTLEVPEDGLHLVRVTHEKAAYFRPAPAGTQSVEIDVFDVAAKVKGVTVDADVMRLQTDAANNTLRVVDHFFIKNDSKPQLTQFSAEPFDFYLPEGAVVDGSAAMAPGGMPVQAAPVPLADKGHYTFVFPIRPGETQFQISYHLPYSGKFDFVPRMASPTGTIALMMPKSMTFTPVAGNPYQSVSDEVNAQTYVARNVTLKDPLGFTISGTGQLPRDTQNPDQGATPGAPPAAGPATNSDGSRFPRRRNTMPGKGLDNPLDPEGTRDPWSKYKWWILSGIGFLMVAGAGVLLSKPRTAPTAVAVPVAPASGGYAAAAANGCAEGRAFCAGN